MYIASLRESVPAVLTLLLIWSLALVNPNITRDIVRFPHSIDWDVYVEAARRFGTAQLYEWPGGYEWCAHCVFRYSPLFASLIGLIAPIGIVGWRLLHVAVLPLLGWRLAIFVALSWPFWQDVQVGSIITFTLVAGVWAARGKGTGIAAYLLLALLTPRPVLAPLAIWLLWKHAEWRLPFLGAFLLQALVVAFLGYFESWPHVLWQPNMDFGAIYDYGPARLIGGMWPFLGVVLAVLLAFRGRVGLASLAASPYWLGYYLLMAFIDARDVGPRQDLRSAHGGGLPTAPVNASLNSDVSAHGRPMSD